jgi:hypothetical protein
MRLRLNLTRIVLPLALAAFCASGWAQAPKGAEKPASEKPKAAKEAAKETAPAEKVASGKKSRRSEDARACLEKSSNTEIIKCAEAYL